MRVNPRRDADGAVPQSPYSLFRARNKRHTVATQLLRSGAAMKEVADALRHRSIDTAAIYAKVGVEALRKVAAPWPKGFSAFEK